MGDSSRVIVIVSDFHMGKGMVLPDGALNPLEDFLYDREFAEFIHHYRTGDFGPDRQVDVICNGDFFNLLQQELDVPDPAVMTEVRSMEMIKAALQGHPEVWAALSALAQTPKHRLTFMLGNHDPGLLWPGVQQALKKLIGGRVEINLETWQEDGVYVEHGHRYFADSAYDTRRYFLTKGLEVPVINLPWGCYFLIHYLFHVKKERPFFDKMYPIRTYLRWAVIHDTWFAIKSLARIAFYFLSLRFTKRPTRRSPFFTTLKIVKETTFESPMDRFAKRILLSHRDIQVVSFGHSHECVWKQFAPGKTYINTGLWNEKINLDPPFLGRSVRLTYAHIETDGGQVQLARLKRWKGSHQLMEDIYY